MYTNISQVPARRQWESSSAPWQPYNCGPTSVAFVADFYRDATFPIEATCDLGAACDQPVNAPGTSGAEQAVMLQQRGVPCTVQRPTPTALATLVSTRPVVIGLQMSKVPAATRGHSFTGIHAVVARARARDAAGNPGTLIMDPNFGYGQAVDATNGSRFYPDAVLNAARTLAGGVWMSTIVPDAAKVVTDVTIIVDAVKFLGADGKPANRTVSFAAGAAVLGWALDGTNETFKAGAGGSSAPSDARCTITRTDGKAPKGSGFIRITAGVFADHPYLAEAQAGLTVAADPPLPGPTPPDPSIPIKAAHDAAKDVADKAGVPLVSEYAAAKYPPG